MLSALQEDDMKIVVTGSNGFFASRIIKYYKEKHSIKGFQREELDITKEEQIKSKILDFCPDIVLHCAAVSDLALCEQNQELSYAINVKGTKYLAKACSQIGAKLIFCSSDQVYFKNGVTVPHAETEMLCPPYPYGKQKVEAEFLAMENNSNTVCLRLSMMYAADYWDRKEHNNFFKIIRQAVREKKELSYPIYDYRSITDVWEIVKQLEKIFSLPRGIYNFGSENNLSTYEVVREFLRGYAAEGLLIKNETAFAEEPRNLRMNVDKLKAVGVILPKTLESLLSHKG